MLGDGPASPTSSLTALRPRDYRGRRVRWRNSAPMIMPRTSPRMAEPITSHTRDGRAAKHPADRDGAGVGDNQRDQDDEEDDHRYDIGIEQRPMGPAGETLTAGFRVGADKKGLRRRL